MAGFRKETGANPTGQSEVYKNGKWVLIVRPLSKDFTGLEEKEEIERRKTAIARHREGLGEYCQKADLVVLDGDNGKKLLGRLVEEISEAKPVSQLRGLEVLAGEKTCKALAKINWWRLKQLGRGEIFGMGSSGFKDRRLPRMLAKKMVHLTSNEEMTGVDENGEQKVFVDPDWYEEKTSLKQRYLWARVFAVRVVVFSSFWLVNKIRGEIVNK